MPGESGYSTFFTYDIIAFYIWNVNYFLKEYSKTYYEKYMSGIENMEEAEITLGMLKKANEYDSNFDLTKLEKCDEETTVILTINDEKEVINYKFDLKCN